MLRWFSAIKVIVHRLLRVPRFSTLNRAVFRIGEIVNNLYVDAHGLEYQTATPATWAVRSIVCLALLVPMFARAATTRPVWTSSHVVGSPEPPPPYQLERIYPKLTFAQPTDMAFAPGSNLRFVAQQDGHILSFPDDPQGDKRDVFFDASQLQHMKDVKGFGGFNSLFGLAFPPDFQNSHFVYICYLLSVDPKGDIAHTLRVSRFTVIGGTGAKDPMHCDMASEQIVLAYYGYGHCGGCLKFGPEGDLYISTGDGGDPTPPDPLRTGQDISDLLSSILRIDVMHPDPGKLYSIPADNPFMHTPGARGEVWAYGLRNAWRFSFDKLTGQLWAGDVGWETWESIFRIEKGGNYGWSIVEAPWPGFIPMASVARRRSFPQRFISRMPRRAA